MDIEDLWSKARPRLQEKRMRYSWPPGCSLEESLCLRDHLEACIKRDLTVTGALSMATFRKVLFWGFGQMTTKVTEKQLEDASREAYAELAEGRLADALRSLCALPGVGVSRASKLLALSDQASLGIYDSSAAASLNELAGEELVPEPAGRGSTSSPSPGALADGFKRYTTILQGLQEKAARDPDLAGFVKVRDVEIALFAPRGAAAAEDEESDS